LRMDFSVTPLRRSPGGDEPVRHARSPLCST
jgi:hypothetical protein